MSSLTTAVQEDRLPAIIAELTRCLDSCLDIDGCIVSTVDGHEVGSKERHPIASERLATMNCSALALAETMVQEANQGLCRFLIIENTRGRIVIIRIDQYLLLTCLSTLDSNLGMVLNVAQRTATTLATIV